MTDYEAFIAGKSQLGGMHGFEPDAMPAFLYDFQRALVHWALARGRAAIFADCGLGKTPMQLAWAEAVARKAGGRVLVITPLAVSHQTVREAAKFDTDAERSSDGKPSAARITVTNYERLHLFSPDDYAGVVCDESSAIKSFDGKRRALVTEFLRGMKYRLLCTATAAPNDYIELGTSSEALGELGHMDMLQRFFRNEQNAIKPRVYRMAGGATSFAALDERAKWKFKPHAAEPFWQWVCSWARAIRRPSDIGFDDGRFQLPPLTEVEHVVQARTKPAGWLFDRLAFGLDEQREERRRTMPERCEAAAALVNGTGQPAVVWCHLNPEGDLIERSIPDAIQIAGSDSDETKEARWLDFIEGRARVLVTKPKVGAWGLNLQHCAHTVTFPSHSFEQRYQSIRRFWRFGQTRPVHVDTVTSEGEAGVVANMQRKADAADAMFTALVAHMNDALRIERGQPATRDMEAPPWLSLSKS